MPAQKHDFTKTEIKAGIFVFVSGALLIVFIAAILGLRPTAQTKMFYTFFTDTGGLDNGADVRFGGVKVGRVKAIAPASGTPSLIRVTAEVRANTPVNALSTAYVSQVTLTAAKHLEISTGSNEAALLEDGAEIPRGAGGLFGQLDAVAGGVVGLIEDVKSLIGAPDDTGTVVVEEAEMRTIADLFRSVDGLLADLRTLLGVTDADGQPVKPPEERVTVARVVENVDGVVIEGGELVKDLRGVLEENRQGISDIVTKATEIEDSAQALIKDLGEFLEENRPSIDGAIADAREIMRNANDIVAKLAAQLDALVASLQETLDNAGVLSAEARSLLEENAPAIEDIIADVGQMVRNLKELTRTLAEEPQAVIRGRTPAGRN